MRKASKLRSETSGGRAGQSGQAARSERDRGRSRRRGRSGRDGGPARGRPARPRSPTRRNRRLPPRARPIGALRALAFGALGGAIVSALAAGGGYYVFRPKSDLARGRAEPARRAGDRDEPRRARRSPTSTSASALWKGRIRRRRSRRSTSGSARSKRATRPPAPPGSTSALARSRRRTRPKRPRSPAAAQAVQT